ncbi:lytic murein transglycosylase [Pedococcus bigeumensis]|nr:lytic murein transglycosylase [Pedococcus bigeumensis]
MRRRQVGAVAVAVAAMAVLSASGPPGAGPPTSVTSRAQLSPVLLHETVPVLFAFDDLAPAEAVARFGDRTAIAIASPSATKPKPPPPVGPVGSMPPAGTPQAVLAAAYRRAVSRAPAGCHLQVAHLAALGQVESGSIGGRSVTSDHRVTPAIYGPLLDGGPFAVIRDSDGGVYDGAGDYDRAMGPLQFLPGTWSWAGRDGDGDGRRDPQNVFDAASATADYLCRDGRDLARSGDLRAAVLSYNQSGAYHLAVLEWVSYFQRHGLAALTTVAFRVGSGGRASAMTAPEPDPSPPAAASSSTRTTSANPSRSGTGRPSGPGTPTTPTTPPTTGVPATPTPTPSDKPSPDPTTPQPTTTTPAPVEPDPSPSPTVAATLP